MAKVTIISPVSQNHAEEKIRVAAYCRVSSASDEQLNSYQAQMTYYSHKFENSETEILVDLYADEGISGTAAKKRSEFQRMMKDCRHGKIDRIYTKSVSRFARNTKECLQYVRELKLLGITICFEKENLDTAKSADEMMIAVMAGLAQEESVSISKNIKWAVRKRMQNGTYKAVLPYGFMWNEGKIEIVEQEAEIVRQIFAWYLSGYGSHLIMEMLNDAHIPTRQNKRWRLQTVQRILINERYMGDAVFQKNYHMDTVPFTRKKNCGELPMYYVSNANEAIISREDFEAVQKLHQSKSDKSKWKSRDSSCPLARKIWCACCGSAYRFRLENHIEKWVCLTHDQNSQKCHIKAIPQEQIYQMFVAMFNKLYCYHEEILSPLLEGLHELKLNGFREHADMMEIQNEIIQLKEKIHVLTSLRTKGFLSNEKWHEQTTELNQKIIRMQKELRKRMISDDDDETIEQIEMISDFFKSRTSMMTEFEEEAFTFLVEKITAVNEHELIFHLPGGLKFTEHYPQNKAENFVGYDE